MTIAVADPRPDSHAEASRPPRRSAHEPDLADRYPGHQVGTIGSAALQSPDSWCGASETKIAGDRL